MLVVDTASEICGVALIVDGHIKAEMILNHGLTHTRSVMSAIDDALIKGHTSLAQVDVFGVNRGPGSFTGLRIGVSTVKGLALAMGKPIVGVSSLETLAHQASKESNLICPLMDARRNEVYWTLYQRQGDMLKPIMEEKVGPAADVAEAINDNCYFIGNGVPQYGSTIKSVLKHEASWANDKLNGLRPGVLSRLAWQRYRAGRTDDIKVFTPTYLRKSDAQINKENPII